MTLIEPSRRVENLTFIDENDGLQFENLRPLNKFMLQNFYKKTFNRCSLLLSFLAFLDIIITKESAE